MLPVARLIADLQNLKAEPILQYRTRFSELMDTIQNSKLGLEGRGHTEKPGQQEEPRQRTRKVNRGRHNDPYKDH